MPIRCSARHAFKIQLRYVIIVFNAPTYIKISRLNLFNNLNDFCISSNFIGGLFAALDIKDELNSGVVNLKRESATVNCCINFKLNFKMGIFS